MLVTVNSLFLRVVADQSWARVELAGGGWALVPVTEVRDVPSWYPDPGEGFRVVLLPSVFDELGYPDTRHRPQATH